MAVAFDGETVGVGNVSSATSVTVAKTTAGSDRCAVATAAVSSAPTVSATYGGVAMTAGPVANAAGEISALLYLAAPPTASANCIVSFSTAASGRVSVSSYNGVSQATPVGSGKTGTSTTVNGSNVISASITGVASTDMLVDALGSYFQTGAATSSNLTAGTGQTVNDRASPGTTPNIVWSASSYRAGSSGSSTSWTLGTGWVGADTALSNLALSQSDGTVAPPAFVGNGTVATSSGATSASITPALPSGWAAGDLLVAFVHTCNRSVTTPSGWTLTSTGGAQGTAGAAGGVLLTVFHKIAGAGETAPSIATSGTTNTTVDLEYGFISAFRNVDQTTPVPVSASGSAAGTSGSSFPITLPSVTTTTASNLIVNALALDRDTAGTANLSSWANSTTGAPTERFDTTVSTTGGGGLGLATAPMVSAGSTGSTTVNHVSSTTGTATSYVTFAIQPDQSGAVTSLPFEIFQTRQAIVRAAFW